MFLLFLTVLALTGHAHVVSLGVFFHVRHLRILGLMSEQLTIVQDYGISVLSLNYALPHLQLVSNFDLASDFII